MEKVHPIPALGSFRIVPKRWRLAISLMTLSDQAQGTFGPPTSSIHSLYQVLFQYLAAILSFEYRAIEHVLRL